MPVIGYLGVSAPTAPLLAAFNQGLREAGYVDGQNVAIEPRWANDEYHRLSALAADLVSRKVDVIVSTGGTIDVAGFSQCLIEGGEKRRSGAETPR